MSKIRWVNEDVCGCQIDLDYSGPFPRVFNVHKQCDAHVGLEPQDLFTVVAGECRAKNYRIDALKQALTDEMKALITDEFGNLQEFEFHYTENIQVAIPGAVIEDAIPEVRERELKIILPESLKPFINELAKVVPDVTLE
jgi:hypothetical protein